MPAPMKMRSGSSMSARCNSFMASPCAESLAGTTPLDVIEYSEAMFHATRPPAGLINPRLEPRETPIYCVSLDDNLAENSPTAPLPRARAGMRDYLPDGWHSSRSTPRCQQVNWRGSIAAACKFKSAFPTFSSLGKWAVESMPVSVTHGSNSGGTWREHIRSPVGRAVVSIVSTDFRYGYLPPYLR